jgi:hypothetical protein
MATGSGCINSSSEPGKIKANHDLKHQVRPSQEMLALLLSPDVIPEYFPVNKEMLKQAIKTFILILAKYLQSSTIGIFDGESSNQ